MPSGFITLTHAAIFGLLLSAFVFALFASRFERRPGPIYAFALLAGFTAAAIPFAIVFNDATDLETFSFAFSAHALISRGIFIAWIFYLHALTDFTLRWSPRFMYALEAARATILATNLDTPYLLDIQGLQRRAGFLGDTVTIAVSDPTPLHFIQLGIPLMHIGYAILGFITMMRIGRRSVAMWLAFPVLLLLVLIVVDNLSDALGTSSIYLTELAIPIAIFAVSASLMEWVLLGQRARERLVEREAQMLYVLDSIADAVVVCDREFQIVRMNPIARELSSGRTDGSRSLLQRFEFEDPESGDQPSLTDLVDRSRTLSVGTNGEPRLMRVTIGEVPSHTGALTGYVVVMHDITERTKKERQYRRDATMRALVDLAGGVAHDFNNHLAVIGASSRILEKISEDPRARTLTSRIGEATSQAGSLTRRLLDFSRGGNAQDPKRDELVWISEIVEGTSELIRPMVGKSIEIEVVLRAPDDLIRGDAHELQSALLNLAKNAADAIEGTGTIRIVTEPATLEDGRAGIAIHFSDTGAGIAPENLERVFEPFFTTKDSTGGTGFGLPSVHRAVMSHGGAIEVSSGLGEGTTFRITLPLLSGAESHPSAPSPERPAPTSSKASDKSTPERRGVP